MVNVLIGSKKGFDKTREHGIKGAPPNRNKSEKYAKKKEKSDKKKFNDKNLVWITQDLRKFTRLKWEDIKYPPRMPPLVTKPKLKDMQHTPSLYGEKNMLLPLDLLEEIVKPLVYVQD